jgi:hypothetical protein
MLIGQYTMRTNVLRSTLKSWLIAIDLGATSCPTWYQLIPAVTRRGGMVHA